MDQRPQCPHVLITTLHRKACKKLYLLQRILLCHFLLLYHVNPDRRKKENKCAGFMGGKNTGKKYLKVYC